MNRSPLICGVIIAAATASSQAASIVFPNFNDTSNLAINGAAHVADNGSENVLRLTDNLGQAGSAISLDKAQLANASFSTFFSFQLSHNIGISDSDGVGADGFVFTVENFSNNVGGIGVGIGYSGIPHSVGIEFDTYFNAGVDINGNHVGIDIDGNISSAVAVPISPRLNDGNVWNAWVDYDGTSATPTLEVRVTQSSTRPVAPTLSMPLDLAATLGASEAYVGFTSGTGSAASYHDILQWQFNDSFAPIESSDVVPEVSQFATPALGLLIGAHILRRRRQTA